MMWYYFFGLGVVLVVDMLGIDWHSVSCHFQHIEDAIIIAHGDVLDARKIGGDRKLVEYNETCYSNKYKVFGEKCKSDGDFFIEQVENCTVNTLHEVIRRCTIENLVVCTDGHTSYKDL